MYSIILIITSRYDNSFYMKEINVGSEELANAAIEKIKTLNNRYHVEATFIKKWESA